MQPARRRGTGVPARDEILARIRGALGDDREEAQAVPIPRAERSLSPPDLLDLLADRLLDYKATVHRCTPQTLGASLEAALVDTGRLLVPPDLPAGWAPHGTPDEDFPATELDGFDTVLTACAAAAAETGTIVLDAGPGQGRRALSLVPDRHVCVVRAEQVVLSIPELLERLDPTRPLTFISGPSATSDIELRRVEGVHGPRTLVIVLVA